MTPLNGQTPDQPDILVQIRNDNKDKYLSNRIFNRLSKIQTTQVLYHIEPEEDKKYDLLVTVVITDIQGTEDAYSYSNLYTSNTPQGGIATTAFPTRQGDGNAIAVIFAGGTVDVRPPKQIITNTYHKNIQLGAQLVITDMSSGKALAKEDFYDEETTRNRRETEDMVEDSLDDLARMITRYLAKVDYEMLDIQ